MILTSNFNEPESSPIVTDYFKDILSLANNEINIKHSFGTSLCFESDNVLISRTWRGTENKKWLEGKKVTRVNKHLGNQESCRAQAQRGASHKIPHTVHISQY